MRYVILAVLALCVGCSTFALHAASDGKVQMDSDGTYFAATADGEAHITLFKDGKPYQEYKVDAGKGKAWKRSGWSFWKSENWEEVEYADAMVAIYPPDGVVPEHLLPAPPE